MPSLTWYLNRLGRMSASELAYRSLQAGRDAVERVAPRATGAPSPTSTPPLRIFAPGDATLDPARYVERAEHIMAGRFTFFGRAYELGAAPRWNRDPLTGRTAPLVSAGSLDYRDEALVGDIKHVWEPNRHLHIAQLAQAYRLTGEARFAAAVRTHIDSWIVQCPIGRGPNWSSSLELAIRLINWSLAWQWLGGAQALLFASTDGRAFCDRWLASVYDHTRAITRRLSRYSSANNHLIGELAGVWIASQTWDCWPQMRKWGHRCKEALHREALRQNAPDGGNREQAFAYQQFVLDFLLMSGLAARAAGADFNRSYWDRLERMLEFIGAMLDASGRMPMVGDADDGYVVDLAPDARFDNFRSLLATGAIVFKRPDFAAKAGALDDKTRWLLGPEAVPRFERIVSDAHSHPEQAEQARQRAFPETGYYLLGDRFDTADEVRMLVDAGPLGYLSIAAHGHADALSVILSVGGREVLVDPGTYAYHTQPEWRRYFRGTRAHNTVLVDGRDQSRQSGPFMWSRHAHARCLTFDAAVAPQRFAAEHDGYAALEDPVMHRRDISYDAASRTFSIVDELTCRSAHTATRCWHFAEDLEPRLEGQHICVEVGRYRVRISAHEPLHSVQLHRGGGPDEGGWVSRGFGSKQPAPSVFWASAIAGTATLRTTIQCELLQS